MIIRRITLSLDFEGVLTHGLHIKDTVHQRNFQTSPNYWNADNSGTGRKGDNTGHTGILCPKCQTANLEFFLSNILLTFLKLCYKKLFYIFDLL